MKGVSMKINVGMLSMTIIIGVAFVLGLTFLTFDKKSDYITVGGQSEVSIEPDSAVIYATVITNQETAQTTQDENAKIVQAIKDALKKQDIDERNIQTTNYYLNKKVEWTPEGSIEKGYELTHTLKISTSVLKAGPLSKIVVASGATSIDRIEFIVSKDAENLAVTQAMSKATLAASQKAKTVTSDLHVKLGRVLKIEEGSWWIVQSNQAYDTGSIPQEYAANLITPQAMAVQTNVNVVFEVH